VKEKKKMAKMKDGILLIRNEASFSRQMPNVILLIFMNTGTAMAEEVIFTDIYIFLLFERKWSMAVA
jgi:hypothetical protein